VGVHPQGGEIDVGVMRGSLVAVESRGEAFAAHPAGANELRLAVGQGAIPGPNAAVELGELAAGTRPGRASAAQLTVYKSVGVAAEDAAAAALILRRAVGRRVEL
jgi:ornithine cyclodeaminase